MLTDDHITYIIKDLNYRGIVAEGIQDELIDHVCTAVEAEMRKEKRFIDAYHTVLKRFGHTGGLREIQKQTLQSENKPKNMIKNYFTVALRNLRKHSFYTFINVAGLSLGISICFIIVLFVRHELSYDRHFANADRIYRVHSELKFGGNHYNMTYAPAPMAAQLAQDYPEVAAAIRFRERGSYLVKRTTENIREDRVIWADKDFFKVFQVPILAGDPAKALTEPNAIAISQRIAEKYFPGEEALGQTLILDDKINAKITAIYQNLPSNTHFHFDILIAMEGLDEAKSPVWLSNNFQTYVLLNEGASVSQLNAKIPALITKHMIPQLADALGPDFTLEKFTAEGNLFAYTLEPLTDIHLKSALSGEFEPNFDITYVYLFGAVAAFILLIACVNFMNLSTARSANRAKEVGMRKVMGSMRSHLIRQFLMESILLSMVSFVLATVLAYLLLPVFNSLASRELSIPFSNPNLYAVIAIAAVFIGMLAGIYPSFFLSAFKPVSVLKGNVALGMKSGFIRSSLVVFQFTISIILVIGTMAVFRQLNYIQNKKLGFNKDQVIMIDDAYALGDNKQAFKEMVKQDPRILNATISGYLPVSGTWRSDTPWWAEGKEAKAENMVSMQNWAVDYDYITTMGMTVKEGRGFSPEFPSDSSAVILNEAAALALNFNGEVVGSRIQTFDADYVTEVDRNKLQTLTVVGVVENFHFESLRQNVSPVMMFLAKRPGGIISFRIQAGNTQEIVTNIEKKWKELAPGQPFTYYFLDERFNNMYASETRLSKVFGIFTGLAILIACLGLFALTSFTAEQRTKEIGIRKVLGASVSSIVLLLSKEFGKLIAIAFVLAAPAAWYGVNWWLKDYTYKTEIGIGLFLFAGIAAFVVAWVTMSFQSFRAATSNPVDSLKSE
ncbi:MAG: ABC transporter permease [Bacteroidota bacterium]|nr:MAG: ABC transporter permease [Bacteroidota bacterium]